MFNSFVKQIQGWAKIKGATDGTLIGNEADRLKVDSKTADSGLDSFGRARISESQVIFDASFVDSSRDNLFDSRLTGSASIQRDTLRKTMKVHTTTNAADSATFQSKVYHHYVPGQSFSAVLSFKFDAAQTNLEQCIGLFDDDNGIFLRLKNSTLELVKRTSTSGSVVETVVPQASWNIDVLDGSGPSGITLDITKEQILRIDYQWLGVGRVRASFDIDGEPVKFHEFLHANNTDTIYMQTASLPVRAEVINNATISGDATLEFNCSSFLYGIDYFLLSIEWVTL